MKGNRYFIFLFFMCLLNGCFLPSSDVVIPPSTLEERLNNTRWVGKDNTEKEYVAVRFGFGKIEVAIGKTEKEALDNLYRASLDYYVITDLDRDILFANIYVINYGRTKIEFINYYYSRSEIFIYYSTTSSSVKYKVDLKRV